MISRSITYAIVGVSLGVISSVLFCVTAWHIFTESAVIEESPDTTTVSEVMHGELSKEIHDTKQERALIDSRFVTNDTFLNVFGMLEQIKKETGVALTVESVNAESAASKTALATVRVVITLHGSWDRLQKAERALSATPIALSVVSSEIVSTEKPGEYEGRAVLRVYIKPIK
jgi:hypothetical protein